MPAGNGRIITKLKCVRAKVAPDMAYAGRHEMGQSLPARPQVRRNIYFLSKRLYPLTGTLPGPATTPYTVAGRKVLFFHAPKSAGTSLRALLGGRGGTHAMPRHVLTRRAWRKYFVVSAVREPFERFVSGYSYYVRGDYTGVMYRLHGDALKSLDPFEFLEFVGQYPEKLGAQVLWATYPDAEKPRADLVLRVEESAAWPDQLRRAGVAVPHLDAPRRNASRNGDEELRDVLGLDDAGILRLREKVTERYAEDYEAFGYDRGSGGAAPSATLG